MSKYLSDEYNFDIDYPGEVVLIGDQLTTDIMWGNMNDMVTIWVH